MKARELGLYIELSARRSDAAKSITQFARGMSYLWFVHQVAARVRAAMTNDVMLDFSCQAVPA